MRKTIFSAILCFAMVITLLNLEYIKTNSDSSCSDRSLSFAEASARTICDFNCLTDLEETSSAEGTQKWMCSGSMWPM